MIQGLYLLASIFFLINASYTLTVVLSKFLNTRYGKSRFTVVHMDIMQSLINNNKYKLFLHAHNHKPTFAHPFIKIKFFPIFPIPGLKYGMQIHQTIKT